MEMNQYLDMFLEEAKEHLQAINENLLLLEKDPGNISIVQDIFRSAHTLKGMAATMGFEDMASLTHEMENVLDQVRNGKLTVQSAMMDIIFRCVDILEGMVDSIMNGGDGRSDVTQVVAELKAVLTGEPIAAQELASAKEQVAVTLEKAAPSDIPFDDYEMTIIQQTIENGFSVFGLKIWLRSDCVLKAARAYMVNNSLEALGEVIKSIPSTEDLEAEKFEDHFVLVVVTQKSKEEIEKAVLDVSEIASVEITNIESKQLKGSEETQASAPTASTASAGSPGSVSPSAPGPASPSAASASASKPVEGTAQANATKKNQANKTIRVDSERLDMLMNLFSELVIDRGRLEQLSKELGNGSLTETVEHMNRISGDLQNLILNMRMVPVEQVFNRFPRMVRDLSKELDKQINLQIEGADTELDRTVIDEIGDPLVHLLRNSLDHGLENPKERIQAGKSETGTILLKAYHSGNHVFIEVRDDGKGINRDKVLKKALENGIVTENQAASLTDKQVYELLFASGLSTADKISDISGRGVGLDVVKTKIELLGGSVSVDSSPGKGSSFLIQLPLTLSIISAMLVEVEKEMYAVPLSSIIETAVIKKEQIMHAHQQDVIDFRGKVVPLVSLKNIFKVPSAETADNEQDISVLIIRKGDKMAGLIVDSFIGQQEIVLKSLGKYLLNVFAVSGATILGNGKVALIIDCNQLIK